MNSSIQAVTPPAPVPLTSGQFVRVRKDHENSSRAGLDGMVHLDSDDGQSVALIFGWDRHNQPQHAVCVGPELWKKDELDLTTVC